MKDFVTYNYYDCVVTKDIVQSLSFELVYADTDSAFLKKNGASIDEYENVKETLAKEIGLPISVEHHCKFLVLLPNTDDI